MSPTKQADPRVTYEQRLLSKQVAQLIGGLLESNDIKRSELAERLGVPDSRVAHVLRGTENLTLETVASLAHAVGIRFALVPVPLADRDTTPAADDPAPPRWIAGERRRVANMTEAEGPATRPLGAEMSGSDE